MVMSSEHKQQFLSFVLGDEAYGIDILAVKEIRGWEKVRQLPNLPGYIKGVLDLRGVIVPVVDLRVRFNTSDPEYLVTTVIIVVLAKTPNGDQMFGAVVDSVSDVLDIGMEEIRDTPVMGKGIGTQYISGMVSVNDSMVVLLYVDRLFDTDEFEKFSELKESA
jgi:purine-binding chemotaxis protein CheW